jgi:glycosyltransferase involved in cell wall biosynthesis
VRILYDHQVFSLQNAGGASRYYYELIHSLVAEPGAEIELWLGLNETVYPFHELPRAQVVSCRGFLGPGYRRYLVNELLSNARAPFAGKMDIYHSTLYRKMPMLRARRKIATHHDCAHERFPELFRNAKQIVRAKQRMYADADAIICVSESSRNDLLQFYAVDSAKTRVIYHGLSRLQGCAPAALQLRAYAEGPYLLFVGSRAGYKNFGNLLRAFRASGLSESFRVLAVGGGTFTEEERDLAEQLVLTGKLAVVPQAADSFLAEAYASATLLVYPSLCEGFGYPPLEAMAAGCPALVCRTSCLPEICGDAPFYFDPGDPTSLAQVLLEAASNEAARRQARERGLRVSAQYSWQKCAKQTLALYRECQ